MPFCPTCRSEYRPNIDCCPDCGSALVAELPPDPEPLSEEEVEQVLLCTVRGEIQSSLLRDMLRSEGILSRAQLGGIRDSPYDLAAMPTPVGNTEDIVLRIYVRREDLGLAQQVCDDFEAQDPGDAPSSPWERPEEAD